MRIDRSLAIVMGALTVMLAFSLVGCDKKVEDKPDDKAKKASVKKKTPPARRRPASSGSDASSSGSGGSGAAKKSRRTGKISVDELIINNPDRIENLLKAKEYKYTFNYNIFRDYSVREQEKNDYDKDGIPDLYDDDDDNDGFPDALEIEQGFNPKDKNSHPQRSNILSDRASGISGVEGVTTGVATSARQGTGKGGKGAQEHGIPVEVYETTGIYFRGIFALRNSKVAVLKVIKDSDEKMLLKREGETFKGIQKGKSYYMEEINLQKDYIRVREESSGEIIKLTFEKKDRNVASKTTADASVSGKPGAKKPAAKKRTTKKAAKKTTPEK